MVGQGLDDVWVCETFRFTGGSLEFQDVHGYQVLITQKDVPFIPTSDTFLRLQQVVDFAVPLEFLSIANVTKEATDLN